MIPQARAVDIANRAMYCLEAENRLRAEIHAAARTLAKVMDLEKWEKRVPAPGRASNDCHRTGVPPADRGRRGELKARARVRRTVVPRMPPPPPAIRVLLNGDARVLDAPDAAGPTVAALIAEAGLLGRRVAVEVNGDVVPRAEHGVRRLRDGDRIEMVTFVGGGEIAGEDPLRIGSHVFSSRLIVGTGKYATNEQMVAGARGERSRSA